MSSGSPRTQVINLPLDGSMDQRTHARQTQAPQVLRATNVRYPDLGAVEKRPGMSLAASSFSTGAQMIPGDGKLMACRDEVVATDGYTVGSLAFINGDWRLTAKGQMPEAVSYSKPVDTTQYMVSQPDVAVLSNGLEIHVWCANNRTDVSGGGNAVPRFDAFWTVQDTVSGSEIISQGTSFGGADLWQVHVVGVGTNAMMFWVPSGTGNIVYVPWDPIALTWASGGTLVSDGGMSTDGGVSYSATTDGTNIFVVYQQGAGNVRVLRVNPATGAITASIVGTEVVAPATAIGFGIDANATDGRVWVSYAKRTAGATPVIRACAFNVTLSSQTTAPFTVYTPPASMRYARTGICRLTSTTATVLVTVHDAANSDGRANFMTAPVVSSAGAVVGSATGANRITFWCMAASQPFVVSTTPLRCYAWVLTGGAYARTAADPLPPPPPEQSLQWTMMLVDLRSDNTSSAAIGVRPITWQSPRFAQPDSHRDEDGFTAGPMTQNNGWNLYQPSSCVIRPDGQRCVDGIIRLNNANRTGTRNYAARFDGPDRFASAEIGGTMIVTPGFYWDRRQMAEISFSYWPQMADFTVALAAGGIMTTDTAYVYRIVYEYVDATGAVHRSKPSDPIEVPVGGVAGANNASVSLVIPCQTVTARQASRLLPDGSGIRIVLYRAGPIPGPDQSFYRVFDDAHTPLNDVRLSTITVVDTKGDFYAGAVNPSAYRQQDTLYTAGDILENVMPPGFTSVCTYHNRVCTAYGNTFAYSKFFVEGEAVNFTDAFTLPLEESGRLTALAVLDDAVYMATEDRIYGAQFFGPNDTGLQSDVETPSRITTDRGITDQRSIVTTPGGIMYQSRVGIQMLDRGRSVGAEPIGARVQDDLAAYPEITSALMHPTGGYVTFTARDPSISDSAYTGVRLVYDYTTDRWSRDTLLTSSTDAGEGMISEVESRGLVFSLRSSFAGNIIYVSNEATHLDQGGWVPMEIVMAEVHPQGLQGNFAARRWQLNADRYTDHDLHLEWFKDYQAAAFDSNVITSDRILAAPIEQFSECPVEQRAQSMRVVMKDAPPSGGGTIGAGRGGSWVGIAVEIDPIDGKIWKLAAQERS